MVGPASGGSPAGAEGCESTVVDGPGSDGACVSAGAATEELEGTSPLLDAEAGWEVTLPAGPSSEPAGPVSWDGDAD